jgi:general secretion pathway protein D
MMMARRELMGRKIFEPYRWILSFVLALTISLTATVHAQQRGAKEQKSKVNKNISMDFDQVDIKVFIKFMSELTGKNFVVDDKVRGKVTVLSPTKITAEEAYRVFLSVLEVNGFTTVPSGKVIKIVPSVAARQKSVETRRAPGFVPRPDDRVITQLIPLIYADAQDVRKLLAPLVSKQGVMVAYDPTDTLILTDYQSNIQRLLNIIEEIDVESGEATISVMYLKYAGAEKLSKTITQLVESRQKGAKGRRVRRAAPTKIVPDERINVLIILADWQNTQMIQGLVKKLDKPTPKDAGNIQVIYLENAQAEELAKVLSGLPGKAAVKGKEPVISAEVKVVADKATNSLVITAKPEEFEVLSPVIDKLDIPRKQVFVEALILEVSSDKSISYGVNWVVAGKTDIPGSSQKGVAFGSSLPGGVSVVDAAGNLALPTGLSAGVVSFPLTIGGLTFNNLSALISAAKTNTDFNIISTPQLMTLDNEEASVVVADNIPFSTRVDQGTATTDRAIQSFEYRDVGVTLKVTPQINEKRYVKLKIYEEISRVIQSSVTSGDQTILAPTTRKRTAETNVEVRGGETVVIAGLIGEDSDATTTGVPCLGDIPFLGWLFKSRTETAKYTNMLVFLTPHIVASPDEAKRIYQQKSTYMDEVEGGPPSKVDELVKPPEAPVPETVPEEG